MKRHGMFWIAGVGVAVLGLAMAASAAPPASNHASKLRAQLKDVDAQISAARAHHDALQKQVAQMERQDAAQKKQLQQRDTEIAALQQKLQAAGKQAAPASAGN